MRACNAGARGRWPFFRADREGLRLGKDRPALVARVTAAGFVCKVVYTTAIQLPVHSSPAFVNFAVSQPPVAKFLASIGESRGHAEAALLAHAERALACVGAIQVAAAVVVATRV